MKYLFKRAHLVIDGNKEYLDGSLLVNDKHIEDVFQNSNKLNIDEDLYQVIDCKGLVIMPGFFDSHLCGINNLSFDNVGADKFDDISFAIAKTGTTSFISSLSLALDDVDKKLKVLNDFNSQYANFVGIHLEGPFLASKYVNSDYANKLKLPDVNFVIEILSKTNKLKQMTMAYELESSKEVGKLLHDNNVKVMVGYSSATSSDLDENVDGITHLFNNMLPLSSEVDTLVNLGLESKYYLELIADGIHVNESCLRLALNNIDSNKIMLVSSFCPLNKLKNVNNSSINDELKLLKKLGAKYTELLKYSSLNAYKFYGLDKLYGSLVKGKSSDIVIMDEELNIKNVLVQGRLI